MALAANLPSEHPVTVAVGTNNSGNFTDRSNPDNPVYPASTRGKDWANLVVEQVTAPAGVTVVGANDIENGVPERDGFDNSATRAQQWVTAFLGATRRRTPTGCGWSTTGRPTAARRPTARGSATTPCADGWTLNQFAALTDPEVGIGVLPQIYYPYMAIQWANIARIARARAPPPTSSAR